MGAAKTISLSLLRYTVDTAETIQEKTCMANIRIQAISKIFKLKITPSSFWL